MSFPVEYFDLEKFNLRSNDEEEVNSSPSSSSQIQRDFLQHGLPSVAVVHGPPSSGKTSLAFQYAVSAACRGEAVLFCINQKGLQARIPKPQVPLTHIPDEVLALIEFVYVETYEGACQALATVGTSISCSDQTPRHIIVEENELSPLLDPRAATATLACLVNTVAAVRSFSSSANTGNNASPPPCCGLFISSHPFALPVEHFTVFPFAVCPAWTSLKITTDPSAVVGQNGGEYTVEITSVRSGLKGSCSFVMRYAFTDEAMIVRSRLNRQIEQKGANK